MTGKGRLAVLVLVALGLAVLAWLAFGSREPAAPPVPVPKDTPNDALPAAPIATPAASAPVEREAEAAPPPATQRELAPDAGAATLATMRGRCVDGSGAPLAGCRVRLGGGPANSGRMSEWLRDHGEEPKWSAPAEVTTGSDGRFAFTFAPPPPFQFSLTLTGDAVCTQSGQWSELAPGSTTDLGDIRMVTGVQLSGRIVDDSGRGLATETVWLQPRGDFEDAVVSPDRGARLVSDETGAFRTATPLPAGMYAATSERRSVKSPSPIQLVAERPTEEVTIVLAEVDRSSIIQGHALDASGAPAANVVVMDSNRGSQARTGKDGSFRLVRSSVAHRPTAVLAIADGPFDAAGADPEVAWGTSDVTLHVVAAGALTVAVRDDSGRPVENYLVRLLSRSSFGSRDAAARTYGQHDSGIAVIPGLSRGDWLLEVEFPTASELAPIRENLSHTGGPCRKDLRTARLCRRWLRVVGPNNEPIAGTGIKLCDPFGKPLTDDQQPTEHREWLEVFGTPTKILTVFEGRTDTDGRLELRGPGQRELAIVLLGPGHSPLRQPGVRLDIGDELVVVVQRGARVVGRIVPPEAVAELHRIVGGNFTAATRPQLQLHREDASYPSASDRMAPADLGVADDGTFDAANLPPGNWDACILAVAKIEQSTVLHRIGSRNVTLAAGDTTTLEFDLGSIVPGRIDGLVTNNGEPSRDLECVLLNRISYTVHTDATGRFTANVPRGDYGFEVRGPTQAGAWMMYRWTTPVPVRHNETTTQTFAFTTATLRLTVLDDTGKLLAGVRVLARAADRQHVATFPPTDAAGVTQAMVPATELVLRALPKHLEGSEEIARSGGWFAPQWIDMQTATPVAGQTTALELRLPAAAGY